MLYVFRFTELFSIMHNDSMVALGNRHLNILNSIKLPSAPESILYITLVNLWLVLDSNLVNITDFTLARLKCFTLITSKLWSCSSHFVRLPLFSWWTASTAFLACWFSSCFCEDLETALKWLTWLHSLHDFPHAGHCWDTYPVPQYLFCHWAWSFIYICGYSARWQQIS